MKMCRKTMIIGLTAVLLTGCSSSTSQSASSAVSEKKTEEKGNAWCVQPTLEFDNIDTITPGKQQTVIVSTQTFGNIAVPAESELQGYPAERYGYIGDAVLAEKDNLQGIYSFEGKELYPVELKESTSPYRKGVTTAVQTSNGELKLVYGIGVSAESKAQVFSSDFTKMTEIPLDEFSYDPFTGVSASPYFALKDGVFGVVAMQKSESGANAGWAFEQLDPSVLGGRTLLYTVSDALNKQEQVIYNPETGAAVSPAANYTKGTFANGYYTVSDGQYVSVIHADTGTGIAVDYQAAGFFEDGYAPIEREHKWGFIDTTGKEVTDFVFDSVTECYEGKFYAEVDGKYGVIDLNQMKQGKQISYATVFPCTETAKGTVTVNVNSLYIRKNGSSDGDALGFSANGSVYSYFETKKDDKYTWYRIGENAWIADNGSWVSVN